MTLIRQQLLDTAEKSDGAPLLALTAARNMTSAEGIARELTRLQMVLSRKNAQLGYAAGVAALMWASMMVIGQFSSFIGISPASVEYLLNGLGGVAAVALLCVIKFGSDAYPIEYEQTYLEPLAGTAACLDALQYVEMGPASVTAWRDLALAERGQLYLFDKEVMRCLYELETSTHVSQKMKLQIADACRKVHGLA